jgi:hypothetical protein
MNTIFGSRNGSGSVGCTGEGGYKTRPYETMIFVGASDPSDPVPQGAAVGSRSPLGAGLGSRTFMVALRSEDTLHQVHA